MKIQSDTGRAILRELKTSSALTVNQLSDRLQKDPDHIQSIIVNLKIRKLVAQVGRSYYGEWRRLFQITEKGVREYTVPELIKSKKKFTIKGAKKEKLTKKREASAMTIFYLRCYAGLIHKGKESKKHFDTYYGFDIETGEPIFRSEYRY